MKRRLPPLTALRAFEAAARNLSFRAASEELAITQSAVSHQIAALEDYVGLKLFKRWARRVDLTEAGLLYYPYIRDAFDRIVNGTQLIQRNAQSGDLTVQIYITVAARWLIPKLHDFRRFAPDLEVRLSTSHIDWDFNPDAADVGIIYTAEPTTPGIAFVHLFDATIFPVCTPDIATDLAAELAASAPAHPLSAPGMLTVYTALDDWERWMSATGIRMADGVPSTKFDNYLLAIEAAVDGLGLALVPHFMVAAELRSGRLVRPFPTEIRQSGRWYLACRKERAEEPRIAKFRTWLLGLVGDNA